MEQNLPIMVKKVWSLMRVIFFIIKKGISKAKLFTDLNLLTTRGNLAGKSLHNLLFHHHHAWAAATFHRRHAPPPPLDAIKDDVIFINAKVMKALEDMVRNGGGASPEVCWKSPVGKELRITDSPFPLSNGDGDGKVDEAADKFIMRFHNDLRRQY